MEWKISTGPVPYPEAVALMEARVRDIREEKADELVWLLEHPALFTAGTSASEQDLVDTLGFPVFKTGRGGQYTYHGPGQRVAYVMLDLKKRKPDVRWFVRSLEAWIISTLAVFGMEGFTREGRVGVWVNTVKFPPPLRGRIKEGGESITEAKIAAIGVRIRKWVSYHGISININPDLSHYRGIVPCGIREFGVTSLEDLRIASTKEEFDEALMHSFMPIFG